MVYSGTKVITDHTSLTAEVLQFGGWYKSPEDFILLAGCKAPPLAQTQPNSEPGLQQPLYG